MVRRHNRKKTRKLITFVDGKIECDMNYFTWDKDGKIMFNYKLSEYLDMLPRLPEEKKNKATRICMEYN